MSKTLCYGYTVTVLESSGAPKLLLYRRSHDKSILLFSTPPYLRKAGGSRAPPTPAETGTGSDSCSVFIAGGVETAGNQAGAMAPGDGAPVMEVQKYGGSIRIAPKGGASVFVAPKGGASNLVALKGDASALVAPRDGETVGMAPTSGASVLAEGGASALVGSAGFTMSSSSSSL